MEKQLSIQAHAKVNLLLKVRGRLRTGLHIIESLVCPIELADRLDFQVQESGPAIEVIPELTLELRGHLLETSGGEKEVSDILDVLASRKNLVFRAIESFFEVVKQKGRRLPFDSVRVRLLKAIPYGAGLGGGSADAAATILALNSLANNVLSQREQHELGASLGSDVPVLLWRRLALIRGDGSETVSVANSEFSLSGLPVVIVKPPVQCPTAEAYSRLGFKPEITVEQLEELLRLPDEETLRGLAELDIEVEASRRGKVSGNLTLLGQKGSSLRQNFAAYMAALGNDFELTVREFEPEVDKASIMLTNVLSELNSSARVMLSGSGSTLVVFCEDEDVARSVSTRVKGEVGDKWFCCSTRLSAFL